MRLPFTAVGIVLLLVALSFVTLTEPGGGSGDDDGPSVEWSSQQLVLKGRAILASELEMSLRDALAEGEALKDSSSVLAALEDAIYPYKSGGMPLALDARAGLMLLLSGISLTLEPSLADVMSEPPSVAGDTSDMATYIREGSFPPASGFSGETYWSGSQNANEPAVGLFVKLEAMYSYAIHRYDPGPRDGSGTDEQPSPGDMLEPAGLVLSDQGTLEMLVDHPALFYASLAERMENQCGAGCGDVARTVRYILTTLARQRAASGLGMGQSESPRNILNEGDVELALNIALMLEEMVIFGTFDPGTEKETDRALLDAGNASTHTDLPGYAPDNPTGRRQWGGAEFDNYGDYTNRRDASIEAGEEARTLGSLLDEHVLGSARQGIPVDPADLLALYLYMDDWPYPGSANAHPGDNHSLLGNEGLLYPSEPEFSADHARLVQRYGIEGPWSAETETASSPPPLGTDVIPGSSTPGGLLSGIPGGPSASSGGSTPSPYGTLGNWCLQGSDEMGEPGAEIELELSPRLERTPEYLVAGDDFTVEGVYPPRGWFTTASLDGARSRTGGIPPPPPPPGHDFRLQWEMRVQGSYEISVSSPSVGGGVGFNTTVKLDFPLEVTVWLADQPLNNAVVFSDLNRGGLVNNDWVITNESIAYEYMTRQMWPHLRDAAGRLGAAVQMVANAQLHAPLSLEDDWSTGPGSQYLWDGELEGLDVVGEALDDPGLFTALTALVDEYMVGRGLEEFWLTGLSLEGYNLTFGSFDSGSRFHITFSAMDLQCTLEFTEFRGGPQGAIVNANWSMDAGAIGSFEGDGVLA